MPNSLPPRPDLRHLKQQARDLQKSHRRGDAGALERIGGNHPQLSQLKSKELQVADFKLHDAQLVIAREYGFDSWPKLKQAIEPTPVINSFDRLVKEIARGRLKEVEKLVDTNPGLIREKDKRFGHSPLHWAARNKQNEIAESLLRAGVDPNATDDSLGSTPLHTACSWNAVGVVELLVEKNVDVAAGDKFGTPPINLAIWNDNPKPIVDLLVGSGAPMTFLAQVAFENEEEVRKAAKENPDLLESKIRHYYIWQKPIHFAAFKNLPAMIELLLELGADLNAVDEKGRSPIDLALNTGKTKAYECLLNHGAQPNKQLLRMVGNPSRSEYLAEFHTALVEGNVEEVKKWLEQDPELINMKLPDVWGTGGTFGATPLHWAAMFEHLELAAELIARGSRLEIKDETYNATPLGWAQEMDKEKMIHFLEKQTEV